MRFLLAAGGTGGHIYPAIAIARQLIDQCSRRGIEAEAVFAGDPDGLEGKVVPANGFVLRGIKPFRFPRRPNCAAAAFPYRFVRSLVEARRIVKSAAPDAVIGTGGFVPVPILLVARKMGKPIFIHEQNVIFGMGNKLLLKRAERVFVAFPSPRMERNRKMQYVGNPIREVPDITKTQAREKMGCVVVDDPLLLVFGGSQGARNINNAVLDFLEGAQGLPPMGLLHVTGSLDATAIEQRLAGMKIPDSIRYRNAEYMEDLITAMVGADLVMCRAGASTLAELCAVGAPSILVPFPFSAGGHQMANAVAIQESGGAALIRDEDLSADRLEEVVCETLFDPLRLEQMSVEIKALGRPDAAEDIAREIIEILMKE